MRRMDRVAAVALYIRIVETGSFSKAAAEFGITQPTATKAVAAMEERLGARLLHRTTRGVSPTEVGALYYDKCKAIAHEIEAADNLATLMQCGVHVIAMREFPDHCSYTPAVMQDLEGWLLQLRKQANVTAVLCTRKDLVKIPRQTLGGIPLLAVNVELEITLGREAFEKAVAGAVLLT